MTITRKELHALRVRLTREFGIPKAEACECVDLVAWDVMSAESLIRWAEVDKLDRAAKRAADAEIARANRSTYHIGRKH